MFSDKQKEFLKRNFKEVSFYTDTSDELTAIKRIKDKNIVVLDQFIWTPSEELFKKCENIELIVVNTTAYDNIPVNILKKYKIKLANLAQYATQDVAEVAITMMMSLNSNLDLARRIVQDKSFVYKKEQKPIEDVLKKDKDAVTINKYYQYFINSIKSDYPFSLNNKNLKELIV